MGFFKKHTLNIDRLKAKGKRKIYHATSNEKKVGVTILISHKVDVTILTVYAYYNRASK